MARPKSEDRRDALLAAATKVFAEHGLAASTSLISSTAGVSEGSLFTYFKTKDELVNALYREIRLDLADAVLANFPRKASVRQRLEHVFTKYVSWGVENPAPRKALKLVSMSNVITGQTRAEGGVLFAEVDRLYKEATEQRRVQALPAHMAGQTLKALAEMTMELIDREPKQAANYQALGFRLVWGALTSKP
jgi:AcrR family transcriptional regulator